MKKYTCILICIIMVFSSTVCLFATSYTWSEVGGSDYNRHRTLGEMQNLALEYAGGGVSSNYVYFKTELYSARYYTTYFFEFPDNVCLYPAGSYRTTCDTCGETVCDAVIPIFEDGTPTGSADFYHDYYRYYEDSGGTFTYRTGNDGITFGILTDGTFHQCYGDYDVIVNVPIADSYSNAVSYMQTQDDSYLVNPNTTEVPSIISVTPYYDYYNKDMYFEIDNPELEENAYYYNTVVSIGYYKDEDGVVYESESFRFDYLLDETIRLDISKLSEYDEFQISFKNTYTYEDNIRDSVYSQIINYSGGEYYDYSTFSFEPFFNETVTLPMNYLDSDDLDNSYSEDFFGDWFTDLKGSIGSLGSDIKNLGDNIGNWFQELINTIKNLPTTILNGLKDLFIPTQEELSVIFDKWQQLLKDRFGLLYECVELIGRFVGIFVAREPTTSITMPTVTIPLPDNASFTFGGFEVELIPKGFEPIVSIAKNVINIVCFLAFINTMVARLDKLLGGKEA